MEDLALWDLENIFTHTIISIKPPGGGLISNKYKKSDLIMNWINFKQDSKTYFSRQTETSKATFTHWLIRPISYPGDVI